mgnify:FL=1
MKIRIADYFPMHPGNYWKFDNGASFVALGYNFHPKSTEQTSIPLVHCWTGPDGNKEYVHLVNSPWDGLSDLGSWKEGSDGTKTDIFRYWPPKLMAPAEMNIPFTFEYQGYKLPYDTPSSMVSSRIPLTLMFKWTLYPLLITPIGGLRDVLLLEEDWGAFRWYLAFKSLIGIVGYGIVGVQANTTELGLLTEYFSYANWLANPHIVGWNRGINQLT